MTITHRSPTDENRAARILVVDDDAAMRMLARSVLEKEGIEVLEADGGRAALASIDASEVDGVLLDLCMPDLDGFATCREMRRRAPADPLPIVVTTGLDDMDAIDRAYIAGATDFVTKPINWPILRQRLRYLVRGRHTARQLEASEGGRRALLDTVPDTLLRVAADGALREAKLASPQPTDLDARLLESASLFAVLPAACLEPVQRALDAAISGGTGTQLELEIPSDGRLRHYEARINASGPDEAVVMLRDITERRRSEARIRELAYQDGITGLANGARLREELPTRVAEAVARHAQLAVLRIGLDELSRIESVFGHRVVSTVLATVGERLRRALPDEGFLGRVEGGDFVYLSAAQTSRAGIEALEQRVMAAFDAPFEPEGRELRVRARVGVAVAPEDGVGIGLLDRAGSALDEARRDPLARNHHYSPVQHGEAVRSADLEARLRRALDTDELSLVYQPKFRIEDRALIGVEALARWNNPDLGAVSPGVFIPLAERCGLILPLGERLLEIACAQAAAWQEQGHTGVPIAVNFSAQQFGRADQARRIAEVVARHGLLPGQLQIEITETAAVADSRLVQRLLGELRALGISVAIDDFGTGFSSLGILRELPFDVLKIDRSFVSALEDRSTAKIIEAIIRMGQALGMEIVAEGVEDEIQLAHLRALGCDVAQGFLLGRPMPAQQIFC